VKLPKPRDNAVTARLTKTKMCHFFKSGKCASLDCRYAHWSSELRSQPDLMKTKLCKSFVAEGICADGENCQFAHGEGELRVTEGIYKTQMCHFFERGRCLKGDRCNHAHGSEDLRMPKLGAGANLSQGQGSSGPAGLRDDTPAAPLAAVGPGSITESGSILASVMAGAGTGRGSPISASAGGAFENTLGAASTGSSGTDSEHRSPLRSLPLAELLADTTGNTNLGSAPPLSPFPAAGLPSPEPGALGYGGFNAHLWSTLNTPWSPTSPFGPYPGLGAMGAQATPMQWQAQSPLPSTTLPPGGIAVTPTPSPADMLGGLGGAAAAVAAAAAAAEITAEQRNSVVCDLGERLASLDEACRDISELRAEISAPPKSSERLVHRI